MKKRLPFPWDFPLSSAVVHNEPYVMELSWLIWTNFETNILEEWIENQTIRIMENIKDNLNKIWWDMSNIVKTRIYLVNIWDYAEVNKVYSSYFNSDFPSRCAVEVSWLPAWALIEIECIASWEKINWG